MVLSQVSFVTCQVLQLKWLWYRCHLVQYMDRVMRKRVCGHMPTVKAQISLRITWSGFSLSAKRIIGHYRMYQWRWNARMRLRMRGMNPNLCILRMFEDMVSFDEAHVNCNPKKGLLCHMRATNAHGHRCGHVKPTDTVHRQRRPLSENVDAQTNVDQGPFLRYASYNQNFGEWTHCLGRQLCQNCFAPDRASSIMGSTRGTNAFLLEQSFAKGTGVKVSEQNVTNDVSHAQNKQRYPVFLKVYPRKTKHLSL